VYVCMSRSINKCTSICTPKMIICLICTCIPLYITVFKGLQNPHHKKLTTSPDWLQYTLNYFSKVKVQYNKISTQIRQLHKFVDRVPGHPKGSTKKQTSRPKSSLENGLQSHVKNSNTCRDANGNDNRKAMRFGGDWTSQSLRIWLDA